MNANRGLHTVAGEPRPDRRRFTLRYLGALSGEVESFVYRGNQTKAHIHREMKRAGMRVIY